VARAKQGKASNPRGAPEKWLGPDKLRSFLVPLASIKADPDNARVHEEHNLELIRSSLQKNGQVQLLVVYKGLVMAGNARLQIMEGESWTHAAVLDVSEHFTSKAQAHAFALMDNRSAEFASWDFQKVAELFRGMPEGWQAFTGFTQDEANGTPPTTGDVDSQPDMVIVRVTPDQYQIIKGAVAKVQESEGADVSEGRALELICADYLGGS